MSDERLEYILSNCAPLITLKFIRIGSRTPVVLPQRITPELVVIRKYPRFGSTRTSITIMKLRRIPNALLHAVLMLVCN